MKSRLVVRMNARRTTLSKTRTKSAGKVAPEEYQEKTSVMTVDAVGRRQSVGNLGAQQAL